MRLIKPGFFFGTWAVLAIALAGCVKVAAIPAPPAKATTPTTAAVGDPGIKLNPVDKVGFDALVAGRSGHVILIDFWATWCPECREDFPHTVELDRKFGSAGLIVISLACDDADQSAEILTFLREQKATFQNLRAVEGNAEKTSMDFDIEGGALPHYKLYDGQGKLRKTFAVDPLAEVQFSIADIDAAVEELLAENQGSADAAP